VPEIFESRDEAIFASDEAILKRESATLFFCGKVSERRTGMNTAILFRINIKDDTPKVLAIFELEG
jgi:hypothetical protein